METLLQGQKLDEEIAAVKRHLQALSAQKLKLQNDYVSAEQDRPKRVAVPQIPLAEPPAVKVGDASGSTGPVDIVLKSLKPPLSFTLSCPRTSSIGELKALLVSNNPTAPPADAQRWLHKGKALADGKLLQEYDAITDGETVHLMFKPGAVPAAPVEPAVPAPAPVPVAPSAAREGKGHGHKGHPSLSMSIPKIVMDPDDRPDSGPPSVSPSGHRRDGSTSSISLSPRIGISESFRTVAYDPDFWVGLHAYLQTRFGPTGPGEENARLMFETFLQGSKEFMTPSVIALIRDRTGVSGMAGR